MDEWCEGVERVTGLRTYEMKADIPARFLPRVRVFHHTPKVWFIERLSSHIRAALRNCYHYSLSKLKGLITLKILTPISGDHLL